MAALAGAAAVSTPALAACAGRQQTAPPSSGGRTSVKFALANTILNPSICYYWIGLSPKLDWYADESIDAEWTGYNGATVQLTAIQQGAVQIGVGFQDPMFQAVNKGVAQPYKMFFNATYGILYWFGVLPDSPITTFEQLRGKQLAVQALGSASHYYAQKVLESVGINPQTDVKFVPLYGPGAAVALEKGTIDCIVSFDTDFVADETVYGHEIRLLEQPDFIKKLRVGNSLGCANTFLEQHREAAVGAARVTAKAEVFTSVNPEAALRLHFDMYPDTLPTNTSVDDAVEQFVPGLQKRMEIVLPPQGLAIGEYPPNGWRDYLSYQGLSKVDPEQYYTNDLIKAANDFDRAEIEAFARDFKP
ncbi:ABC transporter substrate-binding protein [Actinophytocola sp.]|uniref:ABC transporter substrate-binding protein n=1 Tax=Actinophytocola sp. TaxID=1872138 RepID=UPI003D6B9E1A